MKQGLVKQLSWLDRFLPLWIFLAMGIGVGLGHIWPGIGSVLDSIKIADVSLPIAIGLIWMMYPVLAKVRYESLGEFAGHGRLFGVSLLFNWVIGPILMFGLAWVFLPDMPEYRTGLILVGLARCIAMVLVWNMLARGSNEIAAILVALNSVFQILMYSVLGYLFLAVVPRWFGAEGMVVNISMWQIAKSVLIFLGIPLAAGFLTRAILVRRRGVDWYDNTLMPKLGPTALIGLLYTIVLMFSMQGEKIVALPLDVVRIALPLLVYFVVIWGLAFIVTRAMGFQYHDVASVAFTAAGNNFELAIAVAVGIFGIASGEALAAVVGPLIEVPALIGLVYVALWAQRRFFPASVQEPVPAQASCVFVSEPEGE
ncbi:MAG: ACR3 family arsenite efflux transporter [Armatimonadota bacterium]